MPSIRKLWVLGLAFTALPAFGADTLESPWLEKEVVVDGLAGEWKGAEKKVKGTKLKMATAHDGQFL